MTQLSDALAADWQRRLRLPSWRPLVLSLSIMGAIVILTASYYRTSIRAEERLEAVARADAQLLAAALAEDAARAVPLAALLGDLARERAEGASRAEGAGTGQAGSPAARRGATPASIEALAAGSGAGALALYTTDSRPEGAEATPLRRLAAAGAEASGGGVYRAAALERVARAAADTGAATGAIPLGNGSAKGGAPLSDRRFLLAAAQRMATGRGPVIAVAALRPIAFEAAARGVEGEVSVVPVREGDPSAGAVARSPSGTLSDAARLLSVAEPVDGLGLSIAIGRSRAPVREQAASVVSIEIMVMALLATLALFMDQRRTQRAMTALTSDAAALHDLNTRLRAEVEERRRIEAELRAAEAGLREAEKLAALGQMSAAVSHELSQPVAALRTYIAGLRLLLRQRREEEATETLGHIDRIVERMTGITRELKALARRNARAEAAAAPVVDLAGAAAGAAEGMQPLMKRAGVSFGLEGGSTPLPVRAERHRIEQVLSNLLQNALDALGPPPENADKGSAAHPSGAPPRRIELVVSREGRSILAEVADSGPGLKPGTAGKVFEPFFTTKPQGEGLGLGLAISAAIATDLGGRLDLMPPRRYGPCRGARFRLTLPVANGAAKGAENARAAGAA